MGHTNQPANNQFVFDGKLKGLTLGLFVLGLVCLVLTYATDSEYHHAIFWSNLLHNTVFFTGISFAALFFICVHTLGWGGWHTVFRRVPEAMMMYMPVGAVLVLLIGVGVMMNAPGTEMLYMWADEGLVKTDKLLQHKSPFLNPMVYLLTVLVIGIWAFFASVIRKISNQQDTYDNEGKDAKHLFKLRFWAAIFLPIAGFSSAFAIWQWVMSVDAHWYSTLFAWYASVSLWVSSVSLMLLLIVFLQSRGHMTGFSKEHMHDLGKYIFGFSVFWTYLWFSQFMLIWYANNGEETQYFFLRFEQFKPIFFLNILINFLVPFFTLMMNSSKRTLGTVGFIAGLVIFGHWLDFYQMIKPGVWHNIEHHMHAGHDHSHSSNYTSPEENGGGKAVLTYYTGADSLNTQADSTHTHAAGDSTHTHAADSTQHGTTAPATPENHDGHNHGDKGHAEAGHDAHAHGHSTVMGIHFPGLLELGTMLGFLGLFLFVTFSFLAKSSLLPKNDPFLEESEHHHI